MPVTLEGQRVNSQISVWFPDVVSQLEIICFVEKTQRSSVHRGEKSCVFARGFHFPVMVSDIKKQKCRLKYDVDILTMFACCLKE